MGSGARCVMRGGWWVVGGWMNGGVSGHGYRACAAFPIVAWRSAGSSTQLTARLSSIYLMYVWLEPQPRLEAGRLGHSSPRTASSGICVLAILLVSTDITARASYRARARAIKLSCGGAGSWMNAYCNATSLPSCESPREEQAGTAQQQSTTVRASSLDPHRRGTLQPLISPSRKARRLV